MRRQEKRKKAIIAIIADHFLKSMNHGYKNSLTLKNFESRNLTNFAIQNEKIKRTVRLIC